MVCNGPKRSNCLIWALSRWIARGGYIGARQSLHIRGVPHFLWSSNRKFWWGYAPLNPKTGWRAIVHALCFRGTVELEIVTRRPETAIHRSPE